MANSPEALESTPIIDTREPIQIWMADDDPQEHLLIALAAEQVAAPLKFSFMNNGLQLLTKLDGTGPTTELPHAIVLDLRMPGMDGTATLQELQKDTIHWQIPVIVFTSSSRVIDEMVSYQDGAVWFETKPSTMSEMEQFLVRLTNFSKDPRSYARPSPLTNSVLGHTLDLTAESSRDDFDYPTPGRFEIS